MASKVPKFGAWEEGGENYTVYFDKARDSKHTGKKINPNDPEENPDMYRQIKDSTQTQTQTQTQTRANKQRTQAKVPHFGAWENGDSSGYTQSFENVRKDKLGGPAATATENEPQMNRDMSPYPGPSVHAQARARTQAQAAQPQIQNRADKQRKPAPVSRLRPWDTGRGEAVEMCRIRVSARTDTTSRNYGRAPLIEDLFADSARSRPSVKEDTYGGGISTKYGQRDREIIVEVSNTGQGYYGVSPPQVSFPIHPPEQKSTHHVNSTVTAHPLEQKTTHQKNPSVVIHQPEHKSTQQVNRTTTVHRPKQKSNRLNPTANVHPREQKSTHRVNSTVTAHPLEQKTTHQKNPSVVIHQPEQKSTHQVNRTTTVHRPKQKSNRLLEAIILIIATIVFTQLFSVYFLGSYI